MNGPEWLGFGGSLLAAASAIWAVIISKDGNKATKEIQGQVVNGHGEDKDKNLREQLDRMEGLWTGAVADISTMKNDMGRMKDDIGGIRQEIRTERDERIAGDRRRMGA